MKKHEKEEERKEQGERRVTKERGKKKTEGAGRAR